MEVEPVDDERHLVEVTLVVLLVVDGLTVLVMLLLLAATVAVVAVVVDAVLLPPAEVEPRVVVVAAAAVAVIAVGKSGESNPDLRLPGVDLVHRVGGFVAPARDGLDVLLCQVVEDLADVQVLLHGSPKELEAGVASELLNLEAEKKMSMN